MWWYNILIGQKKRYAIEIDVQSLGVIALVVISMIAFLYVRAKALEKNYLEDNSPSVQVPTPELEPSATPTTIPIKKTTSNNNDSSFVDCIGPDGKEFRTSEAECKKFNESWGKPVDYIINCNVNSNCGGGTRRLKKSECDNSTCCQIGSSWIFYTSKDKCSQDQGNNTTKTTQKTQGNNFYCWNNAYGYAYYTSSGDQCNLDNLKSGTYKICMNTQKMKGDTCNSVCKSAENQDSAACAWAYTGSSPGIVQSTDKYGECLNGPGGASETYGTCLGKCTDQYGQDIKQCSLL